jgi:heavy metal sensor kinase
VISVDLQSIRTRLTIWHLLVFGGILVLFAAGTSAFLVFTLNRQLDDSLKEDVEIVEQVLVQSPEGSFPLDTHPNPVNRLERFMEIWSTDGRLLLRSRTLGDRSLGGAPDPVDMGEDVRIRSLVLSDSTRWRMATAVVTPHGLPLVIRLAVSEGGFYSNIRNFVTVLLTGVPFGLLLVIISGYMLARGALRPIDAMAARAKRIGVHNLKDRIPIKHERDELGRLAIAFNDLLIRVERSFEELKRFTADASHELRTPLTAMRSVGEVGVQGERTPAEYREIIGSMLEEISRLTRLVDSLLYLSRADGGRHQPFREEFDLLMFAREIAGLISILAEERGQSLRVEGEDGLIVSADRSLLSQAVLNLLDNAIKFSPERSEILLHVGRQDTVCAWLEVIDRGPGIPVAERERIFERFYRLNRAQTRGHGGTGLGLAIARWAVEANGGVVRVVETEGGGSTFRVELRFASK